MTRKPKKCRKCGNRDFHILTESSYKATIDGSNRHIVPSSIVNEEIKSVKCTRCGKELAADGIRRRNLGISKKHHRHKGAGTAGMGESDNVTVFDMLIQ